METPPVAAAKHVYKNKWWKSAGYCVPGAIFGAGGLATGFQAASNRGSNVLLIALVAAFLLALAAYFFGVALRSRLVIEGTRIEVRGAFRQRSSDLSEIEGFRTVSSRYGSFRQLVLKEGRGAISIQSSFKTDDHYRAWFQQIPDLDQRDRQALLAEIEKQQDLGATPEERLGALTRANRQNKVLLVFVAAAVAGLNFAPHAWLTPCAVLVILAPFAAAYLCWSAPLLSTVFKRRSDPRADTSYILLVASFGLLLRMRENHFLSVHPLLPAMALAAVAVTLAYYRGARTGANRRAILAVFLVAALYGYSAIAVADVFFDNAPGQAFTSQVVDHHVSRGSRSTTYYLRLAPWGPVETADDVSVPSSLYRATHLGDTICLDLHPGRLHAPWFHVVACPSAPLAQP